MRLCRCGALEIRYLEIVGDRHAGEEGDEVGDDRHDDKCQDCTHDQGALRHEGGRNSQTFVNLGDRKQYPSWQVSSDAR